MKILLPSFLAETCLLTSWIIILKPNLLNNIIVPLVAETSSNPLS